MDKDTEEILKKYRRKLDGKVGKSAVSEYEIDPNFSREYDIFRKEALSKRLTLYESLCNIFEKILKVKPGKKDFENIKKSIEITHINITPEGAGSLAAFTTLFLVLLGILVSVYAIVSSEGSPLGLLFLSVILILGGLLLFKPISRIPINIATKWRLGASNQMVLCILYIVMYMRHTSNLENAIKFSAQHIKEPLSLDLRKIFWDIETGKFSTLKESLDNYLVGWRDYNLEFVNAFHLIESSLYEPSEDRRVDLLDKSLETILNGTYDRMLHFAHELQSPVTILYMLGVILPILGLVIFPLVGSFLSGAVKWYHLFILYDIILPIVVYSYGVNILSKRPTGYGDSDFGYNTRKRPLFIPIFIFMIFFIIGISPLFFKYFDPTIDFTFGSLGKFFDFKCENGTCIGPYGVGALLLGLLLPLGLAISIGIYYKLKVGNSVKIREETKKLESEFSASLFQLGNRIGDGVPAEIAFETVAETMHGTPSGNFFQKVVLNIRNLGMNIEKAIFNLKNGAILYYPSALVESSMEVLVESARKGPKVVARSLISISNYVQQISRINERIKDLLSEIVSSMKSQINFLAPVIAGIVVGISSMIVGVISKLGDLFEQANQQGSANQLGNLGVAAQIFNIRDVIPGYYFQLIVGIYLVEIIIILTIFTNAIENGSDKLNEEHSLSKSILKSVLVYTLLAAAVVLIFNSLAIGILTVTNF